MLRADDSAVGLPQRAAVGLIRLYKILLSPLFTGSCRFVPSCSDYAREAILEYGVIRGAWLAARRLGRCHPLGSSGVDPVPLRRRSGQAARRGSAQAPRI